MIQLLKTKYRSLKQNTDSQNTIHPGWSDAKQSGLLDECATSNGEFDAALIFQGHAHAIEYELWSPYVVI